MFKPSGETGEKDRNHSPNVENFLVLSIDQNGKIVYFNKECEKIIGYYQNEVLNKKFDFLIPHRYYDQWKKLFESVKQNNKITDLQIPWQTRDGKEIVASWDIAPIETQGAGVGNIGLVGKLINLHDNAHDHIDEDEVKTADKKDNVVYKFGNKRIIFTNPKKTQKTSNENKKKSSDFKKQDKDIDYKKVIRDYNSKKLKKTYEEYDKTSRSIEYLEKRVKELEEENKKLKKSQKVKNEDYSVGVRHSIGRWSNFLFAALGINKKRQEFNNMIKELDERKQALNDLETKINDEKRKVNEQLDDFVKWREKLEMLEGEVEKRRSDLVHQEEIFEKKLTESLNNNICVQSDGKTEFVHNEDNYHDVFEKISESAVLVQRGILKDINQSFADLIGFSFEELLDKSFFDFIAPEGLSGMEQYYMDRLKGIEVSFYDTVFLDSSDEKIFVEVEIKPIIVDGEKAEVFIVKKIKK